MKTRSAKIAILLVVLVALNAVIWSERTLARFGWADHIDLLLTLRHEIVTQYVEEPDQDAMLRSAIRGMISSLGDPYTSYLAPEDLAAFDKQVLGTFSGIGAEVMIDPTLDRLKIVSPLEESPAWEAGVMAGDVVLDIEGESTLGMSITDAVDRLTGPQGTQVTFTVRRLTGEELTFTVTRKRIEVQTVKGLLRGVDQHWRYMIDEDQRIGYVRLTQFTEKTASELETAIRSLADAGARGVILDVRFNPGGLLPSAVEVAGLFLQDQQVVVSVRGRSVSEKVHQTPRPGVMTDVPLVVLANGQSASASEIVAGALLDHGRAQVIGSRTFGKGSVQQVTSLGQAYGALKMTRAYYYLPSGRLLHRVEGQDVWGVDPADGFYVPMTADQMRSMLELRRENDVLRDEAGPNADLTVTAEVARDQLGDPQLAAAIEALRGKISSGEWPRVGKAAGPMIDLESRRADILQQKAFYSERLSEMENELAKLEAEFSEALDPSAADDPGDGDGDGEASAAVQALEPAAAGSNEPVESDDASADELSP